MRYLGVLVVFISFGVADVDVCNASGLQLFPEIVKSGSRVYACWIDNRDGPYEVYVQKITEDLEMEWGNGIRVSRTPHDSSDHALWNGHRLHQKVISSIKGLDEGIIVTWVNYHRLKGGKYSPGIYLIRITSSGIFDPDWPGKGDSTLFISSSIFPPSICSDGDGGCVVVVSEKRYNAGLKKNECRIRAKKLDSKGRDFPPYGWTVDVVSWTTEVLGDPKVVKVGNKVMVCWCSVDAIYQSEGSDEYTRFYARTISLSSGVMSNPLTIEKKHNKPDENGVVKYYWDILDFDLKARDNGTVYVGARWAYRQKRTDLTYTTKAKGLMVKLYKISLGSNNVEKKLVSGYNINYDEEIIDNAVVMPIEQMPIRPAVLALRDEGGVIVHPEGRNSPSNNSDTTRTWGIKVVYFEENLNLYSPYYYGWHAHLPDIIGIGNKSILVYSEHNSSDFSGDMDAKIKVLKLDEDGNDSLEWHTSSITPKSSPKIIKSDDSHCIIVWDEKNSSTEWDIKAVRLNIEDLWSE